MSAVIDAKRLLLTLTLGIITPGLQAQQDFFFDDDEEETPVVVLPWFNFEIGLGYLDKGTGHFGRDTGLGSRRVEPLLNFRIDRRPQWDGDSAYFWRAEGFRLGWDSQRINIEAGEQGKQTFGFSWRELPSQRLEGGRTPFTRSSSGVFTLPTGWQATGNTTAGMRNLSNELHRVTLGAQRERLDLNYWRAFGSNWSFTTDFRHDTKEGSRSTGAIFGYTGGNPRSALLPALVDQTTRILDASVKYSAEAYVFGLGYHASFYENKQSSIIWQNPYGQHPQWAAGTGFPNGSGRLSVFPDNEFHQLRSYLAWRLSETSQFNADIALGRMEQNERFIPYTLNPNIALSIPLPNNSLEGEIDTTLVNLRLSTRPADRLNLVFNYRYDERDNGTAQHIYQLVGADSEMQRALASGRINLPYSYGKHDLKADATWRFARRHRIVGGIQYAEEDRDNFAEVASLDEWNVWAGLRGVLSPRLNYRVDYKWAERRYDEYDGRAPYVAGHLPGSVAPDSFENHPNLRKFNMANRDRNQTEARLDFQPTEVLSLGMRYRYSRDDYDDERFGLDNSSSRSITLDAGYYPVQQISLSGFYAVDRYETSQLGRDWPGNMPQLAFSPLRNWFADHDDRIDTASISLQFTDIARRYETLTRAGLNQQLDMGIDLLFMRTRGEIDVTTGSALSAAAFPDTVNRLNSQSIWARYQFSSQWYARMSIERNRFDSQNYAVDGVNINTLANVILLGQQSPDYRAHWVTFTVGRTSH
jgi:MtrB/PioB family decaheme-associated outer membrane protein